MVKIVVVNHLVSFLQGLALLQILI